MVKYFFFKTFRERNPQGQLWTNAHPLPGQTTYESYRERNAPVDPALKVQMCATENHKVVSIPMHSIIGVKYESGNERDLALRKCRRGDTYIYRNDNEVFLVHTLAPSYVPDGLIRQADAEMLRAYQMLVQTGTVSVSTGAHAQESTQPSPSASPAQQPSRSTAPAGNRTDDADTLFLREERINTSKLTAVESHLSSRIAGERDMLGKLLMISQIRDKVRIGVCKFSFVKNNGDLRVAYGTLKQDVIDLLNGSTSPENERNSGGEADGGHFYFFDVQKKDWRNFCTENIVSVSGEDPITDPDAILRISRTPVAA